MYFSIKYLKNKHNHTDKYSSQSPAALMDVVKLRELFHDSWIVL